MRKIKTIFERNWDGDGKITRVYAISPEMLLDSVATEKLDGTNVRVTIRNHMAVRLEKRRNPTKFEKAKGIIDPWYTDASESSEDKYIQLALKNTDLSKIPDGEWNAEALGPNIQGNELKLTENKLAFFMFEAPVFEFVPVEYDELAKWLPEQKSKYGNDCGIEGIVWHHPDGGMYKIKTKDFL